nr:immunoglobulin light chain junction region [Macaca mulatta]MOW35099.1 immunoglobulin light chain junction region [Macaca mulatta]MOW35470.1 immunoglobulin light chain junction region [Macaca mulatta]MOW35478.1 immunoglobulin light chain junction region [Macaca mulatta]
CQHGYGLLDSF